MNTPRASRWLALGSLLFLVGFAVSAVLYGRSRSADSDANARAVAAVGRVRHLDVLRSQQVLEARFGLLNEYDSLNATGNELDGAEHDLEGAIRAAVGVDAAMRSSLDRLDATLAAKRTAVERFKAENALLRNSTYYLPTAAADSTAKLGDRGTPAIVGAMQRLVQTGLAYDLVGDESSRQAHVRALDAARALDSSVPADVRVSFGLLLAHGEVIGREVPAVDKWVAELVAADTGDELDGVERAYEARFAAEVDSSNLYRKILYGWSLVLLVAIGGSGVQLRRLYRDLERRVEARTSELNRALAELWGEMKLARKIQSALVPIAPVLAGCETAARMSPTREVGGDYYDVVREGENEWILIGDVSGHGVSAGLIMMMCHTAVRTVLRSEPDVGPARLLALVNGVLTQAIAQLGEEKYMTMAAFRRSPDGVVRFAGAHQDVHLYCAAKGTVEAIETRGMWLGIKPDIEGALPERELRLAVGDVLLLHTDGITEAADDDGRLFDERRLADLLERSGPKRADEILGSVFSALEGWHVDDDATLIVVKQVAAHSTSLRPTGSRSP